MRKSIIRIVCFMLILGTVLGCINKILKVKYSDGIYGVAKFYELEDDTVDVLFLGSSHAFENFNTGTLWDEYGMASYILSGSVQPMWNTYYYFKEALKTQKPKVIVLEGYLTTWDEDYIDDSRIIKNNFGLRWSLDKFNSIKVSSPEERWSEFILEYEQYHTRYRELSSADFLPNQNYRLYDDWKGFGCNMMTTPLETVDVSGVTERVPLYEKTEKYYRMILELAREEDIPIVVVISPYAGIKEEEQQIYNAASDIAKEYGVPFINFNFYIDEMGLDFSTDAGDVSHLNYRGNQKYSLYFGNYLKENYDIPDRRGESKYDSWQRSADYVRQMIADQQLVENYDINILPDLLCDPDYWVFISVDGNCSTADENVCGFLQRLGIWDEGVNGIWLRQNNTLVWNSGVYENEKYIRTSAHDFCLRRVRDEAGQYGNAIIIDNAQYVKVTNGVNVIVYDTVTEKIADIFGINMDDGYSIIK